MAAQDSTTHPVGGYDEVRIDRDRNHRTITYLRRGLLHRLDGPAVDCGDGQQRWYRNGLLHRDGGPAVIAPGVAPRWFTLGIERHADTLQPGLRTHANQPHTLRV